MEIPLLVKKHVLAVLHYGSSIDGTAHAYSDIDLCIVAPTIATEKKKQIGVYFASKNYDVKFFDELPIILKMEVMRCHRVLYISDECRLFEHFLFWQKIYDHFAPYHYRARNTLKSRLKQWKSRKKLKKDVT